MLQIIVVLLITLSVIVVSFRWVSGYSLYFLVWNLLLAALPYMFYRGYQKSQNQLFKVLFGVLWLLFYPNAFYLITDVIHIQRITFYRIVNGVSIYNENMLQWLFLTIIVISIFFGLIIGFASYFGMYQSVPIKFKKWFHPVVSFLVGIAIVLGRFARLNSWDVFTNVPFLFRSLASLFSVRRLALIILFAISHFVFIMLFHWIIKKMTYRQLF